MHWQVRVLLVIAAWLTMSDKAMMIIDVLCTFLHASNCFRQTAFAFVKPSSHAECLHALNSLCAPVQIAGEEVRWTMQSQEFDSQIQRLTGDCAVASAFVSYLGPFNKEFRELLMSRDFYGDCIKLNIPVTQNIQVREQCLAGSCIWVLPCACHHIE